MREMYRRREWIEFASPDFSWRAISNAFIRLVVRHDGAAIPTGFPVTFVVLYSIWYARKSRVRGDGWCGACGYDLRHNITGVCPECGYRQQHTRANLLQRAVRATRGMSSRQRVMRSLVLAAAILAVVLAVRFSLRTKPPTAVRTETGDGAQVVLYQFAPFQLGQSIREVDRPSVFMAGKVKYVPTSPSQVRPSRRGGWLRADIVYDEATERILGFRTNSERFELQGFRPATMTYVALLKQWPTAPISRIPDYATKMSVQPSVDICFSDDKPLSDETQPSWIDVGGFH